MKLLVKLPEASHYSVVGKLNYQASIYTLCDPAVAQHINGGDDLEDMRIVNAAGHIRKLLGPTADTLYLENVWTDGTNALRANFENSPHIDGREYITVGCSFPENFRPHRGMRMTVTIGRYCYDVEVRLLPVRTE